MPKHSNKNNKPPTRSVESVALCLERIARIDAELQSFVCLRSETELLREAQQRDNEAPRGALHGVPFAVKDVFDTVDLPTEFGSPYYRGYRPAKDAAVVELMRQAGAILIGKTSTVEFAGVGALPPTKNPHNPGYSPGGSSAGSGAAVGAGLVPLALATQTGGSTIRPAAFCGVAGMKPTWGRVSVEGMKPFAPGLDTVGWIAQDADLLARTAASLGLCAGPDTDAVNRPLRIGYYPTPYIADADADALAALDRVQQLLRAAGHTVNEVPGPRACERLNEWQDAIMFGEGMASLQAEMRRDPSLAHDGVRDLVENRKGITAAMMKEAYDALAGFRARFDSALGDFDAWLTPAVPGAATRFEEGNGLATFNRLFTALHLPCISLPVLCNVAGLPVGVQLVSARFSDHRLLQVAARVEAVLQTAV